MREKIRLYVNVLLLMFVILAVLSLFFSVRNMTEIRSVSAYEDQGVYTFVPVEVSPVQEENNASGRMRRNHPVKTVYVVSYQASDGSGYEYDYEAGSVDTIAQKIVEEGEPIERRVFSVPDEGTYITVEADETAETYVAGQRKRFVLISIVSVLYLAVWGMMNIILMKEEKEFQSPDQAGLDEKNI